mmetsp:Transcript_24821/g.28330  ORF Transcript_24821/g.28330 Transcript_24821/m.28330 type:complete len:211 (+) Transcript_24821:595-1227(+)
MINTLIRKDPVKDPKEQAPEVAVVAAVPAEVTEPVVVDTKKPINLVLTPAETKVVLPLTPQDLATADLNPKEVVAILVAVSFPHKELPEDVHSILKVDITIIAVVIITMAPTINLVNKCLVVIVVAEEVAVNPKAKVVMLMALEDKLAVITITTMPETHTREAVITVDPTPDPDMEETSETTDPKVATMTDILMEISEPMSVETWALALI